MALKKVKSYMDEGVSCSVLRALTNNNPSCVQPPPLLTGRTVALKKVEAYMDEGVSCSALRAHTSNDPSCVQPPPCLQVAQWH